MKIEAECDEQDCPREVKRECIGCGHYFCSEHIKKSYFGKYLRWYCLDCWVPTK